MTRSTQQVVSSTVQHNVVRYSGVGRGAKFDQWVEEVCRGLVKTDVALLAEGTADVSMTMVPLPDIKLGLFDGSPVQFSALFTENPALYLQMPESTAMHLHHCGNELNLGDGFGLADAATQTAKSILPEGGRFRTIAIDRATLLATCPGVENVVARPLAIPEPLRALISNYHATVLPLASSLEPSLRNAIGEHFVDLVSLALSPSVDHRELAKKRGLRAARLAAIKTFTLDNLADHSLSASRVAEHFKISARYLHLLFSDEEATFSAFLLQLRLDKCKSVLCDPRFRHSTISEVALSAGFGDLSYFNRTFRHRFGLTPSEMREQASRD